MVVRKPSRVARALATVMVLLLSGCGGEPGSPEQPVKPAEVDSAVKPSSIEAAISAASDYLNTEDLPKAEAILARLIAKAPGEVRARELMGQVLITKAEMAGRFGDHAAAAADRAEAYAQYRAAVELQPNSAGLRQSAGVMAMMAGETGEALEHFQEAGRLDPRNPQHPLYAAQVLIQQRRPAEARQALQKTLVLDPDEPVAHASLAMIALEEERFEQALVHITEARAIMPDDLRFRIHEAKIRRVSGDPHRAIEMLSALTAEQRAEESVAAEIALAYAALAEHEKAGEAWAHRFRSLPEDPRAYLAAVRAGRAYLRAGLRSEASLWLEQALLCAPANQISAPVVIGADDPAAGPPIAGGSMTGIQELRALDEALHGEEAYSP